MPNRFLHDTLKLKQIKTKAEFTKLSILVLKSTIPRIESGMNHNFRKSFYIIVFSIFLSFAGQSFSISQEEAIAEICNPLELCRSNETVIKFQTIEEGKAFLEPLGGGTILLQSGIYRSTLSFKGNWTLKGLGFPETVIFLPDETQNLGVTIEDSPSVFTVESESSLSIENLTLQNEPEISLFEDNEIFLSNGITVRENGRLFASNIHLSDWQAFTLRVEKNGFSEIIESRFDCPSSLKRISPQSIIVFGEAKFHQNQFNQCNIEAQSASVHMEFDNNTIENSSILGRGTLSMIDNHITGVFTRVFPGEFNDSSLSLLVQVFAAEESLFMGNVFEATLTGSNEKLVDSIVALDSRISLTRNVFRGFSTAITFSTESINEFQVINNRFEKNEDAIQIIANQGELNISNNEFNSNTQCAISIFGLTTDFPNVSIAGMNNIFNSNNEDFCSKALEVPDGFINADSP